MNIKHTFGAIIVFFFLILSYSPIKIEINTNALNETLTNAVWVTLDSVFGVFWVGTAFIILIIGIYYSFFEG